MAPSNDDKTQIYTDSSGKWRWRVRARNGRTITASGEAFASRASAKRAAIRVTGRDPEVVKD